MTTTPFFDEADRAAERAILAPHDLAALQHRVRRAIALRAAATAAMILAALALLIVLGASVLGERGAGHDGSAALPRREPSRAPDRDPAPAGLGEAPRAIAPSLEPAAAPAPVKAAPAQRPVAAAVAVATRRADGQHVDGPAPAQSPVPSPAEAPEASRLRAALSLYAQAQALATTDTAAALARVRRLRAEHAGGPLEVEARLLEVSILARAGRCTDARPLLAELERDALDAGKDLQLREVTALCEPAPSSNGEAATAPARPIRQ